MTLTSDQTVTIERYQPGARFTQHILLFSWFLAGIVISTMAYIDHLPEWHWAWLGLGPLLLLFLVFRFRSVTFEIDPVKRELHREARWAGILLNSRTLVASNFTAIRRGHFDGGRESYPVYWAQLIGSEKYTLVESGKEAEVERVTRLAGELLRLKVLPG